jgi:excisionase family DNA binding protein
MKEPALQATDREWMSLRQLTRYAAVSERTLRAWVHAPLDALPAVRLGGKILVRRREFDVWLENRRVKPLAGVDLDGIVKDILPQPESQSAIENHGSASSADQLADFDFEEDTLP